MSLNPKPTFTFGDASASHAIQYIDRRSKELLHQYLVIEDEKLLQTFLVNLKQLILYVGMTYMKDFKSTSLRAQEIILSGPL